MKHKINNISTEARVISMDALSVHGTTAGIRRRLRKLTDNVVGFLSNNDSLFKNTTKEIRIKEVAEFEKLLDFEYRSLVNLETPCPMGLVTSYLEHAKFLAEAQELTLKIQSDFLIPLSATLGKIIENPERAESLVANQFAKMPDYEKYVKAYGKHFRGRDAKRPYRALIRRQKDWYELERAISDLVVKQRSVDNGELISRVDKIKSDVLKIAHGLEDASQTYRPTNKLIADLSDQIRGLAEFLSFHALVDSSITKLAQATFDAKDLVLTEGEKK